jgi:hypothetical protein
MRQDLSGLLHTSYYYGVLPRPNAEWTSAEWTSPNWFRFTSLRAVSWQMAMSFGASATDVVCISTLAWSIYKSCKGVI